MSTIKLQIKNYLAEYLVEKFPCYENRALVEIPKGYDLYETLMKSLDNNSLQKYRNEGNVEIVIKNSEYFYFISKKNRKMIERKIKNLFWTEVHHFIENEKTITNRYDLAIIFLNKYKIDSISYFAIVKNYYRFKKINKLTTYGNSNLQSGGIYDPRQNR